MDIQEDGQFCTMRGLVPPGVARLVPGVPRPEGAGLRSEISVFCDPYVILAMAVIMLGFANVPPLRAFLDR